MGVPFYNFAKLHHHEFNIKVKERINAIIDKNAFVEGEYNASFEKRFGELQKAKFCPLVANGTDALELALRAYDVGHGDKVGVPGISFFASAEAVLTVGATPVFIDVNPATGLMCAESLKRIVESHKLKAIMPVHIYGLPAPIAELEKVCTPLGIKIVEDAAQGQGGYLEAGKPIGSSNNLTTFSFYPTKNLSAFGDAGAILTQDEKLNEKIVQLRNHGRSPNGHALSGHNSRCDHIQAAVLDLKLDEIEQNNNGRRNAARLYNEKLKGLPINFPADKYLELSSWHLYPIQVKDKAEKLELEKFLKSKEIGCAMFYIQSLPEERPLQNCEGEKENAINFAARTICLPMNPFISKEDVTEVVTVLKEFYNK